LPVVSTVASATRFIITPQGREDLAQLPTCDCHIRLDGLLFACPECGTVWGHVRDLEQPSFGNHGKRA